MDLRDQKTLTETITSIFNDETAKFSHRFTEVTPESILPLISPGLRWQPDELRNVDEVALRQAIRAVVVNLHSKPRARLTIDRIEVEQALRASTCHYLWFC